MRANYDQVDLLQQGLEDRVSQDHPARFIREFVDPFDLVKLGFRERKSDDGRPPYANDLMLKVCQGERSVRLNIAKASRWSLSVRRWPTGQTQDALGKGLTATYPPEWCEVVGVPADVQS